MKALSLTNLILNATTLFLFPIFLGLAIALGIVLNNNYDAVGSKELWTSSLALIILTSIFGSLWFVVSFASDMITIVVVCFEWEKNKKPAVILLISIFVLPTILRLVGSLKLLKHYYSKKVEVANEEIKNASA